MSEQIIRIISRRRAGVGHSFLDRLVIKLAGILLQDIWKASDESCADVVGVDVADETGGNESVFSVEDVTDLGARGTPET